jgi:NTP pyrophosphatase (non-canonical NTP hydrolase)
MDFKEYQEKAGTTAIYPDRGKNLIYPVLGLCGESGEVAEKVKKLIRDKNYVIDQEFLDNIQKEIGDVMWYMAAVCFELGLDMNTVAEKNIEKLFDRQQKNVLHGNGDNR